VWIFKSGIDGFIDEYTLLFFRGRFMLRCAFHSETFPDLKGEVWPDLAQFIEKSKKFLQITAN
jgi:hypothetical protein